MAPEQEIVNSLGVHYYFPPLLFAWAQIPIIFEPQTVQGQWLQGLCCGACSPTTPVLQQWALSFLPPNLFPSASMELMRKSQSKAMRPR